MLPEERRKQLDGIVQQMVQNKEPENTIQFVVSDFKNKYSVAEPEESFTEKTAKVLDTIFGGGKVGEAIGTAIAKVRATPEEKQFIEEGPTAGEVAGSALQSASLFFPAGTAAKGITAGVRAAGLAKGASAVGKVGSGLGAGYAFDVASNLQQGKTGQEALTPGLGMAIGGAIPAAGVAKNFTVRIAQDTAPRVINSLIKPLAKDFAYGKNPGRAVAEEGIIANNFEELIDGIRTTRQKIGKEIGDIGSQISEQPVISIRGALAPLDEAMKTAASQANQPLLARLNNVRRALTEVLEPTTDDAGNLAIRSLGARDLENLTFKQVRDRLRDIGEITTFTGNPSDDKLVNSTLKKIYGNIKQESLKYARATNPSLAQRFEQLTEKYADLQSAEVAAKYRDKIVERSALVGMSPQIAGLGTALITAVATGGATIPAVLAGLTGAGIEKLASTPGFKTRLAYMLSKKTQNEANYLFRKIPALSKFFNTQEGITPGDILLGSKTSKKIEQNILDSKSLPNKQGGFISTPYKETSNLTTKILKDLEGKTTVSKQYIQDLAGVDSKTGLPKEMLPVGIKLPESKVFADILKNEGDKVNVANFAQKIKAELLPLTSKPATQKNYDYVVLKENRGNVKGYEERLYESPIKTSAGETGHYPEADNYFGHTRIEDMADNKTRRVIEVQSDLYQKGNLAKEGNVPSYIPDKNAPVFNKKYQELEKQWQDLQSSDLPRDEKMPKMSEIRRKQDSLRDEFNAVPKAKREAEIAKLSQYNDPTAHFRMVREEIKKAAQDGKTKLQFPTGETAMKIEGLGNAEQFNLHNGDMIGAKLTPDNMKVGEEVLSGDTHAVGDSYAENVWIITRVDADGKFQAVPKGMFENVAEESGKYTYPDDAIKALQDGTFPRSDLQTMVESFDISGKVDTSNPIYKFYEKDIQKYLNKFGGKRVVDDKGVSWFEIPITKQQGTDAVEAFGKARLGALIPTAGATAIGATAYANMKGNKK